MDIEIFQLLLIALIVFSASYIQGIAGFGFGVIAMIFLPRLLLYTEANVLAGILSTVCSLVLLFSIWRKIHWKNLIFPFAGSIVTNYLAVAFMKGAANQTMILLLGIALVLLSIYFFFFSGKIKICAVWYTGLIAGMLSGLMSGLFAIGGPPVVIYYLQSEKDNETYVATLSAFFIFSGVVGISMKVASGFVTTNVLWGILFGALAMLVGTFLGNRTRNGISPALVKKVIYGVMGLSGVVNIATALV